MIYTLTALVVALALIATLLLVLRPLFLARNTPDIGVSHWVLLLLFPLAVLLIYSQVTTYPWDDLSIAEPRPAGMAAVTENPDPARSAIAQMVEGLADRLAQEPDDQQGWEMLGRSYMQLERYQEAADAWREAWRLSEGESVEVAVNFAEALVMSDPAQLRAGAGDLLDAVLDVEPNNSKALWYGGLSAAARGQTDIAEQRWASLLSDPKLPPNVRQLVQQQLAAMGANVPAAPAASTGPAMFRVSIELAPEFAEQVAAGQALFLFARDADGARPPVAVKRLTIDEFPMTTTLRDTDVMMPGLKLTGMENLRIVARVSQSGNAMESAGDFYGEVFPEPLGQSSQKVQVVIDKVVQ